MAGLTKHGESLSGGAGGRQAPILRTPRQSSTRSALSRSKEPACHLLHLAPLLRAQLRGRAAPALNCLGLEVEVIALDLLLLIELRPRRAAIR